MDGKRGEEVYREKRWRGKRGRDTGEMEERKEGMGVHNERSKEETKRDEVTAKGTTADGWERRGRSVREFVEEKKKEIQWDVRETKERKEER